MNREPFSGVDDGPLQGSTYGAVLLSSLALSLMTLLAAIGLSGGDEEPTDTYLGARRRALLDHRRVHTCGSR